MASEGERVGTARVDLIIDSAQWEGAVQRSQNLLQGMGEAGERAYNTLDAKQKRAATSLIQWTELQGKSTEEQKLLNAAMRGVPTEILDVVRGKLQEERKSAEAAAQALRDHNAALSDKAARDNFIAQLQRQSQEFGKTRAQIAELRAQQLGVSGEAAKYIQVLKQQENALYGTGTALNKYGQSQKQVQAALRGVPAQITDIAVSLQGGQAPLTVLLQQGGQLKDMFGGIAPAARALTGQLLTMINPVTVSAAVIGTLAYAAYSAEERMVAFDLALVRSGNRAQSTAQQLADVAKAIDDIDDVTRGTATEAVTAFAAAGRYSAEQLRQNARATAVWATATGDSVDSVVQKFNEIARDPLNTLLKLTDTENFLTEAQAKRIASLVEEGQMQKAAAEAAAIYANVLETRGNEVLSKLSNISQAWRDVKDAASGAWDFITRVADFSVGVTNRLTDANTDLLSRLGAGSDATDGDPVARLKMVASAVGDYGKALSNVYNDPSLKKEPPKVILVDPSLVSGDDFKKKLADQKKNTTEWNQLIDGNLSKRDAQLKEEARIQKLGQQLGKSEEEIQRQIAESRRKYAEQNKPKKDTSNNDGKAIVAQLNDMIAVSREAASETEKLSSVQKALIKIQNDLEDPTKRITAAERERIKTLMETARAADLDAKTAAEQKKAREELDRLTKQLAASEANYQAQVDADLMGIGRGGNVVEQLRRQLAIQKDYEDGLKSLRDQNIATTSQSYIDQEAKLRESRDRMLEIERNYQSSRLEEEGSFLNGFTAAVDDLQAQTADIAGATRDIWKDTFDSLTDAVLEFTETGKLSVRDLVNDMLKQALRVATNRVWSQVFGAVAGAIGGGGNTDVAIGTSAYSGGTSVTGFALGGVPAADISQYSGTVVSKPTFFAKGGNVMGEAGDEGIFPLKRDSSGRLGVSAVGGGGDNAPTIIVNVMGGGNAKVDKGRQTGENEFTFDLLLDQIDNGLASKTAQGTSAQSQAQANRYGLREQV